MRHFLAALAGALAFGLPSAAQDAPDPSKLYLDLAWCGEEAVIQREVFEDIKASLDELGEADRLLAEAIRKPAINPLELLLDRQRLGYFHGVPAEPARKAAKHAGRTHWYGVPVDAGRRLGFYIEKSDQYGEAFRPNCYSVWTQALVAINQAKADRLDGKAEVTPADFDAIEAAVEASGRVASAIVRIALEGGLTVGDKDLLAELSFGRTEVSDGTRSLTLDLKDTSDAVVLTLVFSPLDLTDLWQRDVDLAETFVLLADVGPSMRELLQNFAARQLLASWNDSRFTNRYAPFRDEVALVKELTADMPEAAAETYSGIAYEAAKMVDAHVGDLIQDAYYSELRPVAD